ncbi:ABC transporter substrate-binding protein/permease [Lactobacillus delbrueckii subsp. bulgaricus]|nr:ABC transporter permease [Lactobacillus delbrueckii subsp. bulgaricus]
MKKLIKIMTALLLAGLFTAAIPAVDAASSRKVASGTVMKKIKKSGKLVVGISADYPPLEFTKNVNGKNKYVGVDVELAKQIAKDLGVKLEIKNMDFDSLLVALETGKIDVIISGMTPTAERKKSIDFSKIYYAEKSDYFVISKTNKAKYTSTASFKGKTVGAQTGSLQYTSLKKNAAKSGIKVKGLAKISNLLMALKSGKLDAVLLGELNAKTYTTNDTSLSLVKSSLSQAQMGNAVGVAKGQGDLVKAINKTIHNCQKQDLFNKKYIPAAAKAMKQASSKTNNSMSKYASYFATGLGYTMIITICSITIGLVLGVIFALMRLSKNKLLHAIAVCYIEFLRGTPQMVQIMFVYFGVGMLIKNMPALAAGIIAIGLNSGAYVAEDIRSGINSVAKGQTEAARSLGLSQAKTYRYVVFPQALKNIWPALGNEFITLTKDSSLVSVIGVGELMYETGLVQTATYRGVMPLFITMCIYFVVTFIFTRLLNYFERRMNLTSSRA